MTIDRAEVLRYLGSRGQEPGRELDAMVDEAMARCRELVRPRRVYRIFGLYRAVDGAIELAGAAMTVSGNTASSCLAGAELAAVFAATAGSEVEAEIRALQVTDLSRSLVLDAAATAWIEAFCDEVEAEIRADPAAAGRFAGPRFSPGYGDLPLELQPAILRALDAGRRIGLTCTESLILLPRKSVTALVGIFGHPVGGERPGCAGCALRDRCGFKRCLRESPGREA